MYAELRSIALHVGTIMLPALCRHCGAIADDEYWSPMLCVACAREFPVYDRAVDVGVSLARAHAFADFSGPARRLLIDLKYSGVLRVGRAFGSQMGDAPRAAPILAGADLIVPVPLHWWRRWRRGHNQAAVLARALARRRGGLPVLRAVRRVRATRPQVGLSREARHRNMASAFGLRGRTRHRIDGAVIVVVDDVVTTGTTADAVAAVLMDGGARETRLYAAAVSRL